MQNVYKKCFKKVVMLLRMILLLFYNDALVQTLLTLFYSAIVCLCAPMN